MLSPAQAERTLRIMTQEECLPSSESPRSHSATRWRTSSSGRGRREFVEQALGLHEIGRIEAFGEPAIDLREQVGRLLALALALPQPAQGDRRAQLPRFRALPAGDLDGLTKRN